MVHFGTDFGVLMQAMSSRTFVQHCSSPPDLIPFWMFTQSLTIASFTGAGKLKTRKYEIHLHVNVKLVYSPLWFSAIETIFPIRRFNLMAGCLCKNKGP